MQESTAVRDAILAFFERFSSGDADQFAGIIAHGPGVSVVGSAPGEGHDNREAWISAYATGIGPAGLTLRGRAPRAWEEGSVGFGVDEPSFASPDGSTIPTRLTAVLHREGDDWKIVHLHFSVGVPDEQALRPPGDGAAGASG